MSRKFSFVDVILPLAIKEQYTYRIPENNVVTPEIGMRIIVPLGQRKLYTAIIYRLHNHQPDNVNIREISDFIDEKPIVRETQLKLWAWIADYYLTTLGEVLKAGLPGGLKLESESKIILNESFEDFSKLNERQILIYEYLKRNTAVSISEISRKTGITNVQKDIGKMMDADIIFIEERLKADYQPKKEIFLQLSENGRELLSRVGWETEFTRSPRQKDLLSFLSQSLSEGKLELRQALLYENFSLNIINSLFSKGLIDKRVKNKPAIINSDTKIREGFSLSTAQNKAYKEIKSSFITKEVTLLHGVTSSGKTEIYISLIKEIIDEGRQVLYLLPEIALTSQIVNRLKEVFGDSIGVFHSKFNDSERVSVYLKMLESPEKECKLIIGVRSALFLPFRDLGLVIIDEEHENTFKQFDPAPRYHARDSAIVLASFHQAKVLLGTATPSMETYSNCKSGKYGYVELKERYRGLMLPEILIGDIRKSRLKKEMRSVFTPLLIKHMEETLKNRKQIILFQNRRGYSTYIECETCGWVPQCKSCDVSFTYHKHGNFLLCHYCGSNSKIPAKCPKCNSSRIVSKGFGTELVEDEIELMLPGVKVARLDLDSTRSKNSFDRILKSFGEGSTDILVGTQMLSKGLDFDNVALVGILNADQMLNFPDFRALERSFQLMSQVSGRAGRKNKRGTVIIQTTDPSHPVIQQILANDFLSFYKDQNAERQEFHYPPYVRMIKILIKSKDFSEGKNASADLAHELRKVFGKRVLGPHSPLVSRVKNWYLHQIILKIEKKASFQRAKLLLNDKIGMLETTDKFRKVRINIDVDPY
ncbi:MAG: primosomal protein N' [Bacteroidales bacterium]|nr:primosomal protein N' [Bacteroidales bacterium]MCF8391139.1 primosomal protein N' [Bacteroidales bacterium]